MIALSLSLPFIALSACVLVQLCHWPLSVEHAHACRGEQWGRGWLLVMPRCVSSLWNACRMRALLCSRVRFDSLRDRSLHALRWDNAIAVDNTGRSVGHTKVGVRVREKDLEPAQARGPLRSLRSELQSAAKQRGIDR